MEKRIAELVRIRRMIHSYPELSRQEFATTSLVSKRLTAAGLRPRVFPGGAGLICDIGEGPGPMVALRADLDALPLDDVKPVEYRSTRSGVCHACGHDVHTAILLGAGLELADRAASFGAGRVRLIFQSAEEAVPSGALDAIAAGALDEVGLVYALHCDPSLDVGRVGLKTGPITSSVDLLRIAVRGRDDDPRGLTDAPEPAHVVSAVVMELTARLRQVLGYRPGAGGGVVFSSINTRPATGEAPRTVTAQATVRCLDRRSWERAPGVVEGIARSAAGNLGAGLDFEYTRVAPAVVNDAHATALCEAACADVVGAGAVDAAHQSLGGEDFAWYLERVPGCYARLGVRTPGATRTNDLHSASFDADEGAIEVGVRILTATALKAMASLAP